MHHGVDQPSQDSAESSTVIRPKGAAITLADAPNEVLLIVISFLDLHDIILIRMTCKRFYHLSFDKSIWGTILKSQCHTLPVPDLFQKSHPNFLEDIVDGYEAGLYAISIYRTEREWLSLREGVKTLDTMESKRTGGIQALEIFLDRWLFISYSEDWYELWDLFPSSRPEDTFEADVRWRTREMLGPVCWQRSYRSNNSYSVVSLNATGNGLLFAIPSHGRTAIFQTLLKKPAECDRIAFFPSPPDLYRIKAIEPLSGVAIYCHSPEIKFIHWPSLTCWTILIEEEDDELWSGVVAMNFIAPHLVICVKTRSVEVYNLPFLTGLSLSHASSNPQGLITDCGISEAHVFRHAFNTLTLRGASFSRTETTLNGDGTTSIMVSILAYDVLRGLFYLQVSTRVPYSERPGSVAPLDMHVRVIAAHQKSEVPQLNAAWNGSDGPRGLVSSCALGAQGKRGVWVERDRASVHRSVYAFSSTPREGGEGMDMWGSDSLGETNVDVQEISPAPIQGTCIHEVRSYDLRDDITHCAISEMTGKVIVGTRGGVVKVL